MAEAILRASDTWFSYGSLKEYIVEIDIVDSYVATGEETLSWDASDGYDGTVTAYFIGEEGVIGGKLIIAGNGTGCIYAYANSTGAFENFEHAKSINGLHNLNTSRMTLADHMFRGNARLLELDLSNFYTPNLESTNEMFYFCPSLETIAVSDKWTNRNISNSEGMFSLCDSLCGEWGTKYDDSKVTAEYARIDGADGLPGYFSTVYALSGYIGTVERKELYGVASQLRKALKSTDKYKLSEMPKAVADTYQQGKKDAYDAFWDTYLENGNRTNYAGAFSGFGWTDETFKPKYGLYPVDAYMMFARCQIVDLPEALNRVGKVLDFSNCTSLQYAFSQNITKLKHVGRVGAKDNLMAAFAYNNTIEEIDELFTPPASVQTASRWSTTFSGCSKLREIRIAKESVIASNGFDIKDSKLLSHASIVSIINALASDTNELTVTLSEAAVNKAFETAEGANDGSESGTWKSLIANKSNWTITLL